MELNKKTEQYKLEDLFVEKNWKITGNVYNNTNNTVSISCNILNSEEEQIGNLNYSKSADNIVSVNYDIDERYRHEFTAYMNELLDSVLAQFK
jgi:hypothetical protein